MFVINQEGNLCEEVRKVGYEIDWSDDVQEELNKIYSQIYENVFRYVRKEYCLQEIRNRQDEYINRNNCMKILHLYINGCRFGVYKDIEYGKSIYEKILEGIKNNRTMICLYEKNE